MISFKHLEDIQTMEVQVEGKTEKRRIKEYNCDDGAFMPVPMTRENEMVIRTICGKTVIVQGHQS